MFEKPTGTPAPLSRRRVLAGLAIGAAVPVFANAPALAQNSQGPTPTQAAAPPQPLPPDQRATLERYGAFSQDPTYGEIWSPSQQTVPQGWHPYPPCHWVKTEQYGWYFNDKTPWGQIVHHYGRWKNNPDTGWFWVPDTYFSPGWVLWRTSPTHIGWAPMPPDQDMQDPSTLATLNNADDWLFMDVAHFGTLCTGQALPTTMYPLLLKETTFVTQVEFVGGIAIIVLPVYVTGPIVNINIVFEPWPIYVFTQVIIIWNWIWHHILIVNIQNRCLP